VYYPASNQIALATNGTLGLIQDSSRNIGIGAAPSVWNSSFTALELGTGGAALAQYNNSNMYLLQNNYFSAGGNYTYKVNGVASQFVIGGGTFYMLGSDSGTAGNTVTGSTTLFQLSKGSTLALQGGTQSGGIGIAFPATQSASSDANTLDDYEEGTWTPSVGGTATYISRGGTYTKVGRVVNVQFEVHVNAIGTGNTLDISGLPFASGSVGNGQAGSVGFFSGAANNIVFLTLRLDQGASNIALASLTAAGTGLTTGVAFFANNTRILGSMTYQAS
jgi:hypothetical protein